MGNRYEAMGRAVYDTEEDRVVEYCSNKYEASKRVAFLNKSEQDRAEINTMMRSNRASGF